MNNQKNHDIVLYKLQKTEGEFNGLLDDLERARQSDASINNRDLRQLVTQTFDAMRNATLDALENFEINSNDSGNTAVQSPRSVQIPTLPVESNQTTTLYTGNVSGSSITSNSSRDTISSGITPRFQPPLRHRFHHNYNSIPNLSGSFQSLSLDDPDDEISTTAVVGPDNRSAVGPTVSVETRAEPTAAQEPVRGAVISMLQRMGQRLTSFFQWLARKVKEIATAAWNKVCEAFNAMFNWLGSVWNSLTGQQQYARYHAA